MDRPMPLTARRLGPAWRLTYSSPEGRRDAMAHSIRVQWVRDNAAVMEYEAEARDDEAGWRLFRRLCDVLKALVAAETRRQAVGP